MTEWYVEKVITILIRANINQASLCIPPQTTIAATTSFNQLQVQVSPYSCLPFPLFSPPIFPHPQQRRHYISIHCLVSSQPMLPSQEASFTPFPLSLFPILLALNHRLIQAISVSWGWISFGPWLTQQEAMTQGT